MAKISLPSILQQSTVSIGMMLVQSVVNSFGSEALAGFSAAMRIEALCIVPMSGIGNAISSYTAQNIGAHRQARVTAGYRAANRLVVLCGGGHLRRARAVQPPDHRAVPRRGRHRGRGGHRTGLSDLYGLFLLPDRVQDGGGRAAARRVAI